MVRIDPSLFAEYAPHPLCVLDAGGVVVRINPTLQHQLGYPEPELRLQLFGSLVHPDDRDTVHYALIEPLDGTLHGGFTCRHRDLTGSYHTIQWFPIPLAGPPWLLLGTLIEPHHTDLHLRVLRAEQALQQSERRLDEIQRMTQTGSWELDLFSNQLWWSAEIYRIFELDSTQQSPSTELSRMMIHPDDYTAVEAAFEQTLRLREPFDVIHRILLPDGRIKHVRERAYLRYDLRGTPAILVGSIQDITSWREAELDLRRKDAAVAASLNGIALAEMDGTLIYVNQSFLDMWGYPDTSLLIGKNSLAFWGSSQIADQVLAGLRRHGAWRGEMPTRHYDGHMMTMLVNASLMYDASGMPFGMLASFRDITQRKNDEEALRLKDQAIATSLNAMVIANPQHQIVYANPAFLQLWGYADETEVYGRLLTDFCDPAMILSALAQIHQRGAWQGELRAQRQNGSSFDVLLAASPVRANDGRITHFVASMLDLSESRRLQQQFFQVQKLESVGRLAGGIAHDFNNLLTVMRGYLDLAFLSLSSDNALHNDLTEVSRAVDAASSLTQQLLTFARQQTIAPQPLDLNRVVQRVESMLRRLLDRQIQLRLELDPALPLIRFDLAQCEQLLINMTLNARDAMPNGGILTISTELIVCEEGGAHLLDPHGKRRYAQLTIADTGEGMSAEVSAQIFEPFFTTKPVGKGTGLGLAMVYGAVTQHSGTITVNSTPGHGTIFQIGLPLA